MPNGTSLADVQKRQKDLAASLARAQIDLVSRLKRSAKALAELNHKLGTSALSEAQLRGLIGVYDRIGQAFGAIRAYFNSLARMANSVAALESFLAIAGIGEEEKLALHGCKIVTLEGMLEICALIDAAINGMDAAIADGEAILGK